MIKLRNLIVLGTMLQGKSGLALLTPIIDLDMGLIMATSIKIPGDSQTKMPFNMMMLDEEPMLIIITEMRLNQLLLTDRIDFL